MLLLIDWINRTPVFNVLDYLEWEQIVALFLIIIKCWAIKNSYGN